MYKNILIPVVFEEGQDHLAVFEVAKALAAPDAKFTVMHVLETVPAFALAQVPQDVQDQARKTVETMLASTTALLPGAASKLASGHAGNTIVETAKTHNIDCIVIASHIPGFEDFFLGSTAARVVRHAKCAVHVVR